MDNMNRTHTVTLGAHGSVELPAELLERAELYPGTPLVLVETPTGLVLLTREQLRERMRRELEGLDLVGDLLTERRAASARDHSDKPTV
jgi:bifunctional DNA-binding transcriptional regulator/antitoxin component of YhaV-PrlF toxin-antitoxin module